jgi:hypothetical protein
MSPPTHTKKLKNLSFSLYLYNQKFKTPKKVNLKPHCFSLPESLLLYLFNKLKKKKVKKEDILSLLLTTLLPKLYLFFALRLSFRFGSKTLLVLLGGDTHPQNSSWITCKYAKEPFRLLSGL